MNPKYTSYTTKNSTKALLFQEHAKPKKKSKEKASRGVLIKNRNAFSSEKGSAFITPQSKSSSCRSKNNSKSKTKGNTSIANNDLLLKMSKYKKYQPPLKSRQNTTKKINNTAIGNECSAKNTMKFFPDKIDEKIGISEDIFKDENILLTEYPKENKLLFTPNVLKEKFSYDEWNKLKVNHESFNSSQSARNNKAEKGSLTIHSENPLQRKKNKHYFNSSLKKNSAISHNTYNMNQPFGNSSNYSSLSLTTPFNSKSSGINFSNENTSTTAATNYSNHLQINSTILKYMKILFGDHLENFDENVLFDKIDAVGLKDIVRQLVILAYNQEKKIEELNEQNGNLADQVSEKDNEIKDLTDQLNSIQFNLMGLIQTAKPKTHLSSGRSKTRKGSKEL